MRYMVIIGVGLLILASCATTTSPSNPTVNAALVDLLAAFWTAFNAWAQVVYGLHNWLWAALGPRLQAVLGLLHCLNVLLILWAVYAWRITRRVKHRILGE